MSCAYMYRSEAVLYFGFAFDGFHSLFPFSSLGIVTWIWWNDLICEGDGADGRERAGWTDQNRSR